VERKALEYHRVGNWFCARAREFGGTEEAEGYMAEWYAVNTNDLETNTGYHFMLTEHNCAISNVAESFPSVCGHELQMFVAVY